MSVLVAYGSKHGSTREVAEFVAETLRERGLEVELEAAGEVRELAGYEAVVLGAALYTGRIHRDVRHLLQEFRSELAAVPVTVFAMGPSTTEAADLRASRRQLEKTLAKVPEVKPFAVTIFGGVLNPNELRFPLNRMHAVDARDWDTIQTWAELVAVTLAGKRAVMPV